MTKIILPPQAPPVWNHTPEMIISLTKQAIDTCRTVRDQVAALPAEKCTFSTIFLPLALAESRLTAATRPLTFYENVSPDQLTRDAATEAEKLISDFRIESSMRLDVYNALIAAKEKEEKLSPEEQRLADKMIQDKERAGLSLPEDKREELMRLKKELSVIRTDFLKNFGEEKGTVAFTLKELEGVPEDVVKGYTPVEGSDKVIVTFKSPDIFPLFDNARVSETRKRAYVAFENRLEVNMALLNRLLKLRGRCADILGYKTWADFAEEVRAVKTAQAVVNFLDDLEQKLLPLAAKDLEEILKIKNKDNTDLGIPFDDQIYAWDYAYYSRLFTEQTLSLDGSLVKEYFPVDHVVPVVLEIYQNLLGVEFEEIKGSLWDPDVRQFAVWDANTKDESSFLGWAYFDIYPRESKYPHASMYPIIPGFTGEKGERIYPVAAIVANLAKPTPGRPALMRHHDVVMLFHEIGHVFHELLSVTRFGRFHGTIGPTDFAEAPSQMLENWCWEPEVLKKLSNHFERKEPMPDEMIGKLIQSRHTSFGLFELRQVFLAKYDMQVHMETKPDVDYSELWRQLREQTTGIKYGDVVTHAPGAFGHLVGEYDAGYYSYAYSLVFAADMYKTVFKGAVFDSEKGKLYREKILKPGASRDELDLLKDFLGREPNAEAFLETILGESKEA